jgi:3-dehydroquinate synthase
MKKITVRLGDYSYIIHIGAGIINETGGILNKLGFSDKTIIITNPVVNKFYGNSLKKSLADKSFKTDIFEVPEGEKYKSLESAGILYHKLAEAGTERSTPVLALGGGVIGDLTGFVAATYMRGIPFIQIPTTLLAQVDSSVGGKTAVNHRRLKNEIGAFYQPKVVISDISTLKTLPAGELINGISEIIKSAVIKDAQFFDYLEEHLDLIKTLDDNVLEEIVASSVQIKTDVVESDERDLGLRNVLNFGHTVGHAVESVSDFRITHGQAVAIGMVAASMIAVELGSMSSEIVPRLKNLLGRAGLMIKLPQLEVKQIITAMQYDKKVKGGKIRFILPRSIGQVDIRDDVPSALVEKVLKEMK